MDILDKILVYLGQFLGISLAYLGHILGISWEYVEHTFGITWEYLRRILDKFKANDFDDVSDDPFYDKLFNVIFEYFKGLFI